MKVDTTNGVDLLARLGLVGLGQTNGLNRKRHGPSIGAVFGVVYIRFVGG